MSPTARILALSRSGRRFRKDFLIRLPGAAVTSGRVPVGRFDFMLAVVAALVGAGRCDEDVRGIGWRSRATSRTRALSGAPVGIGYGPTLFLIPARMLAAISRDRAPPFAAASISRPDLNACSPATRPPRRLSSIGCSAAISRAPPACIQVS